MHKYRQLHRYRHLRIKLHFGLLWRTYRLQRWFEYGHYVWWHQVCKFVNTCGTVIGVVPFYVHSSIDVFAQLSSKLSRQFIIKYWLLFDSDDHRVNITDSRKKRGEWHFPFSLPLIADRHSSRLSRWRHRDALQNTTPLTAAYDTYFRLRYP